MRSRGSTASPLVTGRAVPRTGWQGGCSQRASGSRPLFSAVRAARRRLRGLLRGFLGLQSLAAPRPRSFQLNQIKSAATERSLRLAPRAYLVSATRRVRLDGATCTL